MDANPSELRLTGYEYEELRQLTIADLILVHQATWFENTWQTFLSAGRLTGEVALRRKDGSAIEVEYRAVANIVPGLHLSIMRDISERRRAETDLRRSEERFRALIENASDAIALASLAGVVLYVSPAASRILGYAIEELIGASTAALLHPDDRQAAEDLLAQLREHPERVVTIEQRIRRKDGSWCWIEAKIANLLDNPSVGAIVSNYRDISQRKRAERERDDLLEQLRAANDRLRGLSRQLVEAQELERRQIARDLHDQIGQNLAVLNVNIAVARDQLSKESAARVDKQLGYAQQLVDETVEHIRDVLAELRPSELDDYGLAAALRWYVPHVAKRAGFTALLAIREPERRLPPAAEIALFRVVQEALTNVAKHARARRVSVSLETDGPVLYLVVADDGIGFDVDAPGRRGERHGFGLTGMRERVEAVSGRLWIESGPGHGTRVIVELMVQFDHD